MNGLKRPHESMPLIVSEALDAKKLWDAYNIRPPYQRNDYLGWINRAKRDETKIKRLRKMLGELAAGTGYMGLLWSPKQ